MADVDKILWWIIKVLGQRCKGFQQLETGTEFRTSSGIRHRTSPKKEQRRDGGADPYATNSSVWVLPNRQREGIWKHTNFRQSGAGAGGVSNQKGGERSDWMRKPVRRDNIRPVTQLEAEELILALEDKVNLKVQHSQGRNRGVLAYKQELRVQQNRRKLGRQRLQQIQTQQAQFSPSR